MQTFKLFFESRALGLHEDITIKGIGTVRSKVDSGNGAYNVLHGLDIKISGKRHNRRLVTFTTIDNITITKPLVDSIDINIGSGNIEKRPVVVFDVGIVGKSFNKIRFSIADRSQNEEKVLLGKDFIVALGGLIDVTK